MLLYKEEEFLKKFYIQEGNDIISYQKLSENQKEMFNREIVKRLFDSIENKGQNLDTKMIDTTKGDITKLENYSYIKNSLDLLNNIQNSSNDRKIPGLDILNQAHGNIIKYKDQFEKGYKLNKNLIKLFYSQISLALISSISFTIATAIDYIKDPVGNYQACIKYNLDMRNNYPTIEFDALDKFNLASNNGEMDHFLEMVILDKIKEDVVTFGLATLAVVYGIFKLVPLIPEILRLIISMIYYDRIKLADYLRLQAHFIELNISKNKNTVTANKKALAKQEKIMKSLLHLADIVDVNQRVNSKKAKNEIDRENKEISKEIKNSPRDNSLDEIIL